MKPKALSLSKGCGRGLDHAAGESERGGKRLEKCSNKHILSPGLSARIGMAAVAFVRGMKMNPSHEQKKHGIPASEAWLLKVKKFCSFKVKNPALPSEALA